MYVRCDRTQLDKQKSPYNIYFEHNNGEVHGKAFQQ